MPVKVAWGFGSVGTITVLNVSALLLLYFMTQVVGLAPALAGTLLFAAKLVDAVAAPVLGVVSDRTRSRWGRRRPYMFAGAFVSALAIGLLFHPPTGSSAAAYLFACLLLLALGYTLFNVPYLSMPAEMTDAPLERTSIMSWRIAFVSAGGLLTGFAPQLAQQWGGGFTGYGRVGWLLAAIVLVAFLVAVAAASRTRELPVASRPAGAFARFGVVFRNRPFLLILAAKVCQLVGLASLTASALFLFKHVLGADEALIGVWILVQTGTSMASMPIWTRLNRLADKRTLYIIGCVGFAAVTSTWTFAGADEPSGLIYGRGVLAGFFSGGLLLMGQSLLPDAIDWDCRRSGERREGVYAGAYSLIEKGSMAFGPLMVGLILQSVGFAPAKGGVDVAQSAQAIDGILVGAAILPALLYAASVVPLLFFRLDPVPARPTPAVAE